MILEGSFRLQRTRGYRRHHHPRLRFHHIPLCCTLSQDPNRSTLYHHVERLYRPVRLCNVWFKL